MNEVAEKIAVEIRNRGMISFSRFMELALYCPVYGYYEKEGDTVGQRGDFYTSPSVGSLFGELLAFQFADWLTECGKRGEKEEEQGYKAGDEGTVCIVEAGAHRGDLARDILNWLEQWRPKLYQKLEYWMIEPSARRQDWQQRTLAELEGKVRWAKDVAEMIGASHLEGVRGIVFSNELLDAMPAHRLGWDARERVWFEWGVGMEDGRFVWMRMPQRENNQQRTEVGVREGHSNYSWEPPDLPEELIDLLPDGFTTEICPAATAWWRQIAGVLDQGKLVTFDYGLEGEEFFMPERQRGTLRAYSQHQVNTDVLANPGEQDITAHVNFSAIREAGEAMGLRTTEFTTQAQFLTRIVARIWNGEASFPTWQPRHTRQFQTLTHPEHLGRAFRVLVQSRNCGDE